MKSYRNKIKYLLPQKLRTIIYSKLYNFVLKKENERHYNKPKVFGIGNNKTGTTSLKKAMLDLGYKVGDQRTAELLYKEWGQRNFAPIIEYCKTAEFFQDMPFSKPFTFIALDQAFPNSKFILTVRDDAEQWYNSITRFHAKLWGKDGRVPAKEDLLNATYIKTGRPWETNRLSYTTPENNPYDRDILIKAYEDYNNSVIEYFRHRQQDLLILKVSQNGAYRKLCEFLGKSVTSEEFPWENKT